MFDGLYNSKMKIKLYIKSNVIWKVYEISIKLHSHYYSTLWFLPAWDACAIYHITFELHRHNIYNVVVEPGKTVDILQIVMLCEYPNKIFKRLVQTDDILIKTSVQ